MHHDHHHHVNLRKVSDTLRLPLSCSASAFSLWTKFIIFSLGTKVSIKSHNFHHRSHSSSLFITFRLCDHHCHGIAQSALPLNPRIKMFSDSVYFQCFPMQSRSSTVGKQFPRENTQIYMLSAKQGAKYHRLYESHIMGGEMLESTIA